LANKSTKAGGTSMPREYTRIKPWLVGTPPVAFSRRLGFAHFATAVAFVAFRSIIEKLGGAGERGGEERLHRLIGPQPCALVSIKDLLLCGSGISVSEIKVPVDSPQPADGVVEAAIIR
jgi:hypothetical protein